MTNFDPNQLEKISDYSIALMHEISKDIESLNKHIWRNDNNLNEINRKIDLARWNWVNVDTLDNQVKEFRIKLFKRQIKHKIEELETQWNDYSLDISKIEKEYEELKTEQNIDNILLEKLMKDLSNEIVRAKIKHMIRNIKESWWTSVHSIDKVAHEIEMAKKQWIEIWDIEEMLFWE